MCGSRSPRGTSDEGTGSARAGPRGAKRRERAERGGVTARGSGIDPLQQSSQTRSESADSVRSAERC